MLLPRHKYYTGNILRALQVDDAVSEQIEIGTTANDLCEFTNQHDFFPSSKDLIYQMIGRKKKVFGSIAFFQSHFGNLTSLHAMAKKISEPAETTRREIKKWFAFLNMVALDRIKVKPRREVRKDEVPVSTLFRRHSIEYIQLFDAEDPFEIRYRALGMMIHIIQDLYTVSHCKRNAEDEVVEFYYYGAQDREKHKEADDVSDRDQHAMVDECRACIAEILNSNPYYPGDIIELSSYSQASDGGAFT